MHQKFAICLFSFFAVSIFVGCSEDIPKKDSQGLKDAGQDGTLIEDSFTTDGMIADRDPAPDKAQDDRWRSDIFPHPDKAIPADLPKPDRIPPDVYIPPCSHPTVTPNCVNGWCAILAGCFQMGSPANEACRDSDETLHQVALSHAFEIAEAETNQGDFLKLMKYNPAFNSACGQDCPVEELTWHEAAAYCNELSLQKGLSRCYECVGTTSSIVCSENPANSGSKIYDCKGYRLPTEAEWEYAYRAGTRTAYYNGESSSSTCETKDPNADLIGWYDNNSTNATHPIKLKQANPWGLYDMAGNVWEWINDWYQDDLGKYPLTDPWGAATSNGHVTRGGSFDGSAWMLRGAARWNILPHFHYPSLGFRCARTL